MLRIGLIALGANLPAGDVVPEETIRRAMKLLFTCNVLPVAKSDLYYTPAFPDPTGPRYVNACVSLQTDLSAKALLKHLHGIEDRLGRVREERWGARVIDLDILDLGLNVHPDRETYERWAGLAAADQVARTPEELILPHPRIADRSFVLVPLAQIAPLWRHPVTGLTPQEMLAVRPKREIAAIERIETANSGCQA